MKNILQDIIAVPFFIIGIILAGLGLLGMVILMYLTRYLKVSWLQED